MLFLKSGAYGKAYK